MAYTGNQEIFIVAVRKMCGSFVFSYDMMIAIHCQAASYYNRLFYSVQLQLELVNVTVGLGTSSAGSIE